MSDERTHHEPMVDHWVRPSPRYWPPGVQTLTTTRPGPAGAAGLGGWNLAGHLGDDAATVAGNRQALQTLTGVRAVQWLNQVHGTRCLEARAETVTLAPEADAAWTREPGLGLAVLTADCVPVVVAHREASVVGIAHGGWRGLVSGVLENLIESMPAPPGELIAWLGPAIGPDAYEVGGEVATAVTGLPDGKRLAGECLRRNARGRSHLDLFTLSTKLLERLRVGAVHTERLCTYSDQRFFSYRRDGRTGRMVTLAWLDRAGD